MPNQTVIFNILDLLEIMEEGLTEIIQLSLEPVFKSWKEEIEQVLRPYVIS